MSKREDDTRPQRIDRRRALRFLGMAPVGAALAACGAPALLDGGPSPSDGGPLGADGGPPGDGGPLADAGFDPGPCVATESDALGPFFEDGSPARMMIADLDEPGQRLFIDGRLAGAAGCATGLAGFTVDVWQADELGNYHSAASNDYRLRGRVVTGADGRFTFETIKPGSYLTSAGPRPAHLHVNVYAPDTSLRLTTQLYFVGDPDLAENDGCQPPTCFSYDPARYLDPGPTTVDGRTGIGARVRIVV